MHVSLFLKILTLGIETKICYFVLVFVKKTLLRGWGSNQRRLGSCTLWCMRAYTQKSERRWFELQPLNKVFLLENQEYVFHENCHYRFWGH